MAENNADLHGNVPDKSAVALLLVDVINDLQFPGNEEMLRNLPTMAARLARLKARARRAGIPSIYVNDNFGRWRSDLNEQVRRCLHEGCPGQALVRQLHPAPEDYFVLKPKHSGFFASSLEILLEYLEARTLIITGIAGDRCVLFTANDAFLRDYALFVPSDCTVSNRAAQNREALALMQRVLKADIRPSSRLNLKSLLRSANSRKV